MSYANLDQSSAKAQSLTVAALMPCLNEELSVDTTFKMVFGGTRVPDEVIVADGGSTDGTLEKVKAWQARGFPIILIHNDRVFAGAGRNRAAANSTADVFISMDFGNGFDATYVEDMVAPFEKDPTVGVVAGTFQPVAQTPFERCVAVIDYTKNMLVDRLTPEERSARAPKDGQLAPGMSVAWSRSVYERTGGQPEWLRAAEDILFGHRVLALSPHIALQPTSLVYHHMRSSLRDYFRMRMIYTMGRLRAGLFGRTYLVQLLLAIGVIGAFVLAMVWPFFWPVAALGGLGYLFKYVLRPIRRVDGGWPSPRDFAYGTGIAIARDVAIITGTVRGLIDWWFVPHWRRRRRDYLGQPLGAPTPHD